MRIIEDVKLDYNDVLILPKRSGIPSRRVVKLERTFTFPSGNSWSGIPIIAANMDGVGTVAMDLALNEQRCMTALTKHLDEAQLIQHFGQNLNSSIYSLGIGTEDLDKFSRVYVEARNKNMRVCVDVANGYTQQFVNFIKKFRDKYPYIVLMAGNVVTPEMTEELILSGVDIVKVGIGSGAACLTRKVTGVGYPQLSAVIECADAAHGLKGQIIADGGCTVPGDVVKAFAAGADFVMLGSMLAGHAEGLPEDHRDRTEGQSLVDFYGMSSAAAMNLHNGGVDEYRASEGREVKIRYRGAVSETMKEILGGLRSACSYIGARELKELSRRATFVRVNRQLNTTLTGPV